MPETWIESLELRKDRGWSALSFSHMIRGWHLLGCFTLINLIINATPKSFPS